MIIPKACVPDFVKQCHVFTGLVLFMGMLHCLNKQFALFNVCHDKPEESLMPLLRSVCLPSIIGTLTGPLLLFPGRNQTFGKSVSVKFQLVLNLC